MACRRISRTPPQRAAEGHLCALGAVAVVLLSGCGGGPTDPAEITRALTQRSSTADITFHYSEGDAVDAEWQQRFHEWATGRLGVRLPGRLQYFKYLDRAQLEAITGRSTNGFAEPGESRVHSIWRTDGHEALHVYTALLGRPSDFFNEGIAVALNVDPSGTAPQWNGMHVHEHVAMLRRTNRFVPLSEMLTTESFRRVDSWRSYGEAGSFIHFMIREHGIERMLTLFRTGSRDDSHSTIREQMRALWGMPVAEAERRWLLAVDQHAR